MPKSHAFEQSQLERLKAFSFTLIFIFRSRSTKFLKVKVKISGAIDVKFLHFTSIAPEIFSQYVV